MTATIAQLIILKLALWQGQTKALDAELYAYYVVHYSEEVHMDPAIPLAVMFRESNFDQYAVGKAMEIGLFQLKRFTPSTKDFDKLGRRALFDPNLNIYLGIRVLDRARRICHSDNPNLWLSVYNGWRPKRGHCYKTRYSKRVMETFRHIKKMETNYGT